MFWTSISDSFSPRFILCVASLDTTESIALIDCSFDFVPVHTIFPDSKISTVAFGKISLRTSPGNWEGLPYQTESVSFTATKDVSASVSYRDDYSFLMLVVAAIVTVTLYTTAIRKKVNLRWEFSKFLDLLRNYIKVNSPKIPHIRESLEGKKKKFSWQLKKKTSKDVSK